MTNDENNRDSKNRNMKKNSSNSNKLPTDVPTVLIAPSDFVSVFHLDQTKILKTNVTTKTHYPNSPSDHGRQSNSDSSSGSGRKIVNVAKNNNNINMNTTKSRTSGKNKSKRTLKRRSLEKLKKEYVSDGDIHSPISEEMPESVLKTVEHLVKKLPKMYTFNCPHCGTSVKKKSSKSKNLNKKTKSKRNENKKNKNKKNESKKSNKTRKSKSKKSNKNTMKNK